MSYLAAKLVTAVIRWDDHIHGDFFHGHVVKLYADGRVFFQTALQDREGRTAYRDEKPKMNLTFLKREFGKDLDGMGQRFRTMYKNQGYEICSPVMLEELGAKNDHDSSSSTHR